MKVNFEISGLDRLNKNKAAALEGINNELAGALRISAERVRGAAIASILEGNKGGVTYQRGQKLHRASAAGEAPANDTGRLAGSIFVGGNNKDEKLVIAGRGVVNYASLLEFGTSRMGARPFMFPAMEKNRKWVSDRLAKAVQDGIRKIRK